MQKILIAHGKTVEYSENEVKINNRPVNELEDLTPTEYAFNEVRSYYRQILSSHFENLIILTGSGSSVDIGLEKKGKTMSGLWECVLSELGEERIREFCESIRFENYSPDFTDLEAMLSKANLVKEVIQDDNINNLIKEIQDVIKVNCTLVLPDLSPHEQFLGKITARKLKYPRLKLFTLNYDTLFEQAASRNGYIVIDGFSLNFPRRFNGRNFDYDIVIRENSRIKNEENYAKRVFHLYKPHGSLDWERDGEFIKKSENPREPVIIYPKNSKYESSYENPFFEMMSRFQQALRQPNTFLITIGFSFYDKHIASMIREALNVNPSFRLMVVNLDIDNENFECLRNRALKENNTFLVREKFSDFVEHYPFPEIYATALNDGDSYE